MFFVKRGLFRQFFAGFSASLGGFIFSMVFAWVTPISPQLLGPGSEIPMTSEQASWLVSIPELSNLLTPIPAAMLADRIGRKPVILLSPPLLAIGWIMILTVRTYYSLLAARFIQGGATGIVLTVIPVYVGEIASNEHRGAISSFFFIIAWVGYLFEYSTGPFMSITNYTLLNLACSVIFFVLILFQPESPYYYLTKNKRDAAQKSLEWLRSSSSEQLNEELERMTLAVEEDKLKKTSWKEVVATPTDRKALYILTFVGCLRVSSGSFTVVSYATEIFLQTSHLAISASTCTILLGVILVSSSSISLFIMDTVGRRPLLITSCAISSVCLLIATVFYYLQQETTVDVSSYNLVAPVAVLVSCGVSVSGINPVSTAYNSELFNSKTRSIASSISAIIVTVVAFLFLISYQYFVDLVGVYFNFLLFTIVCILGGVISYLFMPETRNKTFEQIRMDLNT